MATYIASDVINQELISHILFDESNMILVVNYKLGDSYEKITKKSNVLYSISLNGLVTVKRKKRGFVIHFHESTGKARIDLIETGIIHAVVVSGSREVLISTEVPAVSQINAGDSLTIGKFDVTVTLKNWRNKE